MAAADFENYYYSGSVILQKIDTLKRNIASYRIKSSTKLHKRATYKDLLSGVPTSTCYYFFHNDSLRQEFEILTQNTSKAFLQKKLRDILYEDPENHSKPQRIDQLVLLKYFSKSDINHILKKSKQEKELFQTAYFQKERIEEYLNSLAGEKDIFLGHTKQQKLFKKPVKRISKKNQ